MRVWRMESWGCEARVVEERMAVVVVVAVGEELEGSGLVAGVSGEVLRLDDGEARETIVEVVE